MRQGNDSKSPRGGEDGESCQTMTISNKFRGDGDDDSYSNVSVATYNSLSCCIQ